MTELLVISATAAVVVAGFAAWLGWQLLRQNGRILLRLDELEKRLDELEFGELDDEPRGGRGDKALTAAPQPSTLNSEPDNQSLVTLAATGRFGNRSLARSKIKRDGLKAGTPAPDFRLPRLDGGELSLGDLRRRRVLLVFSDPHCGPCNTLAPQLQKFHRENADISVVMISRGEPKENRAKVKEHSLTFAIVLQRQREISRLYAMFATPVAYLIDGTGLIARDVAVGVERIRTLLAQEGEPIASAQGFESRFPASFVSTG